MNVKQKLNLFSYLLIFFLAIMGFLMFYSLNDISDKFTNVKDVVAEGNTNVLTIETELNYISRCSKDIFLGNV